MSLEEDSLPDVSICDSLSISSTAQSYTPKVVVLILLY